MYYSGLSYIIVGYHVLYWVIMYYIGIIKIK